MDYVRIKTTSLRDTFNVSVQPSCKDASNASIQHSVQLSCKDASSASIQHPTVDSIKELLKDWIKLYPNSFAPDVELKIYKLEDDDIIIRLHEDMSSLAVALLVLYFENSQQTTDNGQQSSTTAYITIDDTEVLLKQNLGKRAMVYCESSSHQVTKSPSHQVETQSRRDAKPTANSQRPTAVRFLLEDNYVLDYDFERKPQPVKNCDLQFEESEFSLPEDYEVVKVGDVVKKKIDEFLETEELTPNKLMWYLICGLVGLGIGFLVVYLTGM